jgi:hypothetical protein
VSSVCLAAAVVLREWFTDREIRIIARVLGVAGWAVVVTFAWRMTETSETLATQLMVRGKIDATQIADPVRVVAVESEYQTTIGDRTISITKYDDGRVGPVSVTAGRIDPSWNRAGSSVGQSATKSTAGYGQVDRFDDVSHEQHAVTF